MSKKNNNGSTTIKMSEAGEELVKRLAELYDSEIFIREGKELSEQLMLSGIEAGALLSSISMLSDRQAKISAANKAVVQLNRIQYIANAMLLLDLYSAKEVEPALVYCAGILSALKDILKKAPETHKVIRLKGPVSVFDAVPTQTEDERQTASAADEPSGFEDFEGSSEGFDDLI